MPKIRLLASLLLIAVCAWAATSKAPSKSAKKVTVKKSSSKNAKKTTGKQTTAKKTTAKKTTAKKTASRKTAGKKTASRRRVASWRSTQKTPTPERYKEIQEALASKGYLDLSVPSGVWDTASVTALKKFQQEQNLAPSGKIDSLSLIALGLGPRRDLSPAPLP